jgi:alpha-tubulin suppressor-like RCC1 family protein
VTAGFQHTCALTTTGQALCWGRGDHGSLGTGRTSNEALPTPVDTTGDLAGKTITQIAAGGYGTLVIDSDGFGYQTGARSAFAGSAPPTALTFRTIVNPT